MKNNNSYSINKNTYRYWMKIQHKITYQLLQCGKFCPKKDTNLSIMGRLRDIEDNIELSEVLQYENGNGKELEIEGKI